MSRKNIICSPENKSVLYNSYVVLQKKSYCYYIILMQIIIKVNQIPYCMPKYRVSQIFEKWSFSECFHDDVPGVSLLPVPTVTAVFFLSACVKISVSHNQKLSIRSHNIKMAAQFVEILKEKSNELGAYLINWARPEGWSESPLSVRFFCLELLLSLLQSNPYNFVFRVGLLPELKMPSQLH